MNVLLKPELEKFVADKVKAGQYVDASDIVNEALAVLKEQEEFTPEHEEYLRREVGRGVEELKQGQSRPFDAEKIIAEERRQLDGERDQVDGRRASLAEQDYRDIWRHIAKDNPDAADRLLRRIDAKLDLYALNPLMGTARDNLARGLRSGCVTQTAAKWMGKKKQEDDRCDFRDAPRGLARMGECPSAAKASGWPDRSRERIL